jgi:hypothetical protein
MRSIKFIYPTAADADAADAAAAVYTPRDRLAAALHTYEAVVAAGKAADAAAAAIANPDDFAPPPPPPPPPAAFSDDVKEENFFVRTVVPCHIVFVPLYMYQSPSPFRINPLEVVELRVGDVWSYCNALALSYRPAMATWNSRQCTFHVKNASHTTPIDIEKGVSVIDVLTSANDTFAYVCYIPKNNNNNCMSIKK